MGFIWDFMSGLLSLLSSALSLIWEFGKTVYGLALSKTSNPLLALAVAGGLVGLILYAMHLGLKITKEIAILLGVLAAIGIIILVFLL